MARICLVIGIATLLGGCIAEPPPAQREFRGAWVATVGNIDWPSKPGLSSAQQQAEMIAILDRARELNLNAIIFQVRTSCDALYQSDLEPWSEYLSGEQGKAPDPAYDPLALWIEEAHRRGIELHAWFNPFRARMASARSAEAPNHISRTRPQLVKEYGRFLWLDPGELEAREHSLRVMLDVVKRYDIDGVHMDDYFYPYPIKDAGDFPDEPSWQKYLAAGGTLCRADWRRQNINSFIEQLYGRVKLEKPHVKVGISPFGIWQPGHPPEARGFNPYAGLYADAKLWLNRGWCDYFSPQLYWKISATSQPYRGLLAWWVGQNIKGRHIVPGIYTSRVANANRGNWPASEIVDQIEATRGQDGAHGNVHFSMKALLDDRGGIADALGAGPYARPALMPPARWLSIEKPPRPMVFVATGPTEGGVRIVCIRRTGAGDIWKWAAYVCYGDEWRLVNVLPFQTNQFVVKKDPQHGWPNAVAISAIDRFGNESRRDVKRVGPVE